MIIVFFSIVYYCIEQGDGWAPGVLETEDEYNFVKAAQRFFTDIRSYWIGGSTAQTEGTVFPFPLYEIGNIMYILLLLTDQKYSLFCIY